MRRLARITAHFPARCAQPDPTARPGPPSFDRTTDAATALANFKEEGFCILKGVLDAQQVAMYRDHLFSVVGDLRYLGPDGKRLDHATKRFTEPDVIPPREERSYTMNSEGSRFPVVNVGQGQSFHNGDFAGRYADELRLMIEGYVRHDPRWVRAQRHQNNDMWI